MGVVHLAEDLELRRRVALKLLPAQVAADPERRARFLREARSAAVVMHPSIAAVFEVGEDGGELFLSMEHVEGRTLADLIAERAGPMEVREALRIAGAVARGMAKAHEAGVVHRDLKPSNVMVGGEGHVKILDFGVARFVEVSDPELGPTLSAFATAEGRIVGTPGYMAPEQAKGGPVDVRADVFSFGVLLYEMITGVRPFQGATPIERLIAADRDEPVPAERVAPMPAPLSGLIMRCLEKRPEKRPAGFPEIIAVLDQVAPVQEPAEPALRPRSRRAPLVALGVVVAAVAALGVWTVRRGPVPSAVVALPRRPCLAGDPGKAACETDHVVAWCDPSGRSVACCGPGLVPAGADGICGCAPGGTSVPEAIARGCAAAPADHEEAWRRVHKDAVARAIDCFVPLVRAGRARQGELAASYFLTPEGVVFGARVDRTTIPDEKAQRCALDALRSTRFPPPRGEDAGKELSFGFLLGD